MIDIESLKKLILNHQQKVNYFGNLSIVNQDGIILSCTSGYIDEAHQIKYNDDSTYTMSAYNALFVNILLLQAIDRKLINPDDSLKKWLPKLKHASKIKIIDLLRDECGLQSYHSSLLTFVQSNPKYSELSPEKQAQADSRVSNRYFSYEEVESFYNSSELTHESGALCDFSSDKIIVGVEVVRKIYKKDYWDVVVSNILNPLDLNLVDKDKLNLIKYYTAYPNRQITITLDSSERYIGLTIKDMIKIYLGLKQGLLISSDSFNLMKKEVHGVGINFCYSWSAANNFRAYPFNIVDLKGSDYFIIYGYSYLGIDVLEEGESRPFQWVIDNIIPYLTSYKKPKLVALNKKNVYDLLSIRNDPEQLWFMCNTKYMLAYHYSEKNDTCYLLYDNSVAVGTVSIYTDIKKNVFEITNVLVDYRYQGRGYGKDLINSSVEVVKKLGCKKISLEVDRKNIAAYRTYLSCDFKVVSTSPVYYELEKLL
jgi:ribosomal protein S18 acetylase RimI-like enzyme